MQELFSFLLFFIWLDKILQVKYEMLERRKRDDSQTKQFYFEMESQNHLVAALHWIWRDVLAYSN